MARKIFQQPDGNFAEYSTIVDMFIATNKTEEEVIQNAMFEACEVAKTKTEKAIEEAKKGALYGLSWAEAVKNHNKRANAEEKIGEN